MVHCNTDRGLEGRCSGSTLAGIHENAIQQCYFSMKNLFLSKQAHVQWFIEHTLYIYCSFKYAHILKDFQEILKSRA